MSSLRRLSLLVLPLILLSGISERPFSASQRPGAQFPPAEVPPRNDIRIDNRVPIRMRDGVILYADVYRPVGEGRYPVLVSRTPYSTERFPSAYDAAVYFARRGYVYVFQDMRGRHESDGRWEPFFDDEKDGYDTIEWAAKQPWSNGKVAMQGGSYLGQNQWRAAQAAPPGLVTIFPMVASTSIYHDWITLNGALAPVLQLRLGARPPGVADHAEPRRRTRWPGCTRSTTTRCSGTCRSTRCSSWWDATPASTTTGSPIPTTTTTGSRSTWRSCSSKIAIPVHTFGGWFDIFSQGTLRGYVGMSQKGATEAGAAREPHRDRRRGDTVRRRRPAPSISARPRTSTQQALAAPLVRLLAQGDRQRPGPRAAGEAVRHGPQRVGATSTSIRWPARNYRPMYFASGGKANTDRGDGRLTWEKPGGAVRSRPLPLRSGRSGSLGRRQQLLRHAHAAGPARPAPDRGAPGRSDLHVGRSAGGDRGHRPGQGGALRLVRRGRHRFRRQAGGRLSGRDELQHGRGHRCARATATASRSPACCKPGQVYRFEIDLVGTSVAFLKGHRHPRPRDQQPLPAVRSQSEHRREVRHDERGSGRAADHLSRRRAAFAHPAAGDPVARQAF